MLKVNAKVKANTAGISSKIKKIANDKGLGTFLATEAAKGMDKFVPMRTGALSDFTVITPFNVAYAVPYARYVYYGQGKKFSTDKHPNATARWDRAFVAAGGGNKLGESGTNYLGGK